MSTTIDQRVVEMRFDNSHFEKNVSTTMSTLDKLKSKLNLSGASKGLTDINTAAKGFSNTGLEGAVGAVTAKFSALQVMGVTALANITNSAVNAGKQIVKSLTIDPIKTGFQEYETKMGSIQTILANTEHQGTTMDDVTRALEELNLYADKTIYNFQEMTRNIGTFTAAGVDLETSVRSIQGIANLAAVSGSTSQQASTAMYQLSQALATGTVKLMDWNSVVNAGMGGKVFQNALIRTAAMLDGAAEDVEAWQKKNIDAFGSFRDSLTQGEWLTSEVLTRTLEQFTMAAEEGSDAWLEFKKSLMDDGYTEKQAEEILKMANTATDAATKVKTFTQLMDTLKESAQSGWAQTWELIVGDFEEAKAFFTELSDLFGGILGESANRRNSFISEVFSSNWSKLISQINAAGVETEEFEASIRKVVGDNKLDSLIEKYGSLEKAITSGKIPADTLKKALDGIGMTDADTKIAGFVDGLKEIERTLRRGNVGEDVKKLQTALNELGYDLGAPGVDGIIGPITEAAIKAFQEANGIIADGVVGPETLAALEKAGTSVGEITGNVDDLRESCDSLIDVITKTSGRELLLGSLMNVIKAIQRPLSAVGEALRNTFSISPDKLYSGLEKLEKFTSKLVPKGILDSANWIELITNIEKIGVSGPEFLGRLKEVLTDNGVNVDSLINKYDSLAAAFNAGAISIDYIKEALLTFDGVSQAMLLGGETADKLRRTFEGLFAVIDIIGTLAGSGFKIAFEVLSAVLSHFDMDILDLTANIGDAIVGFRDFIDGVLNISGAVEFLMPYVEKTVKGIRNFIDAAKDSKAFAAFVDYLDRVRDGFIEMVAFLPELESFKNLVNVFKECGDAIKEWFEDLKASENLPADIISGLVSGLTGGAAEVVAAVIQLGLDIIAGICSVLGIHSPSTEMMEVGENAVDGLVIGLQNGVSGLLDTVKEIGSKILEWFKNLDFGAIFAAGIGASMIWVVKTIGDALSILAVPFEGFGSMLEDLGDMFEGIGASFKAEAWEKRANAIKSFAVAIAILAASVWVLAQLPAADLWSAVLAITALATIIGILTAVMGTLGAKKDAGSKFKEFMSSINFAAIGAALVGLSIAALGLAAVAKIIGGMDPEEAKQGILGLVGVMSAITVFTAVCGIFVRSKHSKNIKKVGSMMTKLAWALLLMVGVIKLISKLSDSELAAGANFLTAFMAFTAVFAALGAIPGKGLEGIGDMMLKISGALLLMIGVVKLAGQLTNENGELYKAAAFVGAFLAFVLILRLISMIPGKEISNLGNTLLGISAAMLIMVGVAKLIANMEWADMGKAAVGIFGLTVIIALLVGVVDSMGGDAPKIAGTLLAMSVAMGVLAGICILMGMLNVEHLAKGLTAVTVLGLVMAAMIAAARGVQKCTGELVVMVVAIGLMAAAVAALSMIDPEPLATATTAMTILMGMFAIVAKASSNINTSWGTMAAMAGIIAILAGVIILIDQLEIESALETAASISLLMLSLAATMKILSTVHSMATGALVTMGVLTIIVAALAAILGVLSALDCTPSIETAASISILLVSMAAVTAILSAIGPAASAGIAGALGMMGVIAVIGAIALAIGGLMSLIPADKISEWKTGLEDFMDFITILATGLGEAIGGFVGGMLDTVSAGIETFSGSLGKLAEAIGPFAEAARLLDGDTMSGVQSLVDVVAAITDSSFTEKIQSFFLGSSMDTFAGQLKAFGTAMKNYSAEVAGLDVASITASTAAAEGIVKVASAMPSDGLLGLDGIDDFGRNIVSFGKSMKQYAENVAGLDTASVTTSVTAAESLITIAGKIPADGFLGLDGIDDFGRNIKTFGKGMKSYAEQVDGINVASVVGSAGAAQALINVAEMIPDDGFLGMDGIDDFGKNIKSFGKSMKAYSDEVSEVNASAISKSITAANTIKNFITSLAGLDTSGVGSFKSAIKNLSSVDLSGIADSFKGSVGDLKAVGADMGSAIVTGFKSKSSQLKANAALAVSDMATMIRGRAQAFNSAGSLLGLTLRQGFNTQSTDLRNAATSTASSAAMGARSVHGEFYSAGEYLVSGFASGISANSFTAVARAKAMAEAAADAARAALKVKSPSRVFMEIGGYVSEGFAIGIDNYSHYVTSSVGDMANGAIDSTKGVISRIADIINSDVDAQPTIRPVLDLSDVATGASAIGSMLGFDSSVGVMANVNGISTMMNRRNQNGADNEVVSAIDKLRGDLDKVRGNSINVGGVTYDDGSAVGNAVQELIRAMRVEGRI